jgi:hypothetical protein
MRIATIVFLVLAATTLAAPASAQAQVAELSLRERQPAPTAPKPPMTIVAIGIVGSSSMTAADSFEAALGSSRLMDFGGGIEVRNLVGRMFLRGAVARAGGSGTRTHVVGQMAIPNGIAFDVSLIATDVMIGWRSVPRTQPTLAYYVGGGLRLASYAETSQFAEGDDDVRETGVGYGLLFGFDKALGRSRRITVGAEGQYSLGPTMPGATGSLFDAFGEDNLGGLAIRGVVGIRLK